MTFALLLFVLMALAALVIDLGMVRLAQRQMQTAVNTAALEGMRNWDGGDSREAAQQFAALVFDDDGDLANGLGGPYGAGPVFELSGGHGDANVLGSQLITLPAQPVYKPLRFDGEFGLESNLGNAAHGDMVVGEFDAAGDGIEAEDYTRDDFDRESTEPDAFLVRMRRTNDFSGLDHVAGVSSSGPAIPMLFGHGAMIQAADPTAGYSPRHHGFTVRATAIASSRPAKSVGVFNELDAANPTPGVLPLALSEAAWNALIADTPATATVDASGTVSVNDPADGFASDASGVGSVTTLGQLLSTTPVDANGFVDAVDGRVFGYLPIVANPDTAIANRVVGFGYVEVAPGGDTDEIQLTKRENRIAPANASAALVRSFSDDLDDTEFGLLLARHGELDAPLLAPVLVR